MMLRNHIHDSGGDGDSCDAESGTKPLRKWCILMQMTVATTATTVADAIRDT